MRIIGHYATITDRRAASESICLLSVPGSTKGSDPCAAGQPTVSQEHIAPGAARQSKPSKEEGSTP